MTHSHMCYTTTLYRFYGRDGYHRRYGCYRCHGCDWCDWYYRCDGCDRRDG